MSVPTIRETVDGIASQSLWAIAEEYKALAAKVLAAAEENDGIIPEELDAAFGEIEAAHEQKLLGCRQVAVGLRSFEKEVEEQYQALKAYRESVKTARKNFDEYVLRNMQVPKAQGPKGSIWKQNSGPGTKVLDEKLVPDRFKVVTVKIPALAFEPLREKLAKWVVSVDVAVREITDAWKASGGTLKVPGAETKQGEHLRVNTKKNA